MARGPAGVPLSPAGCLVCPTTSPCSAAARLWGPRLLAGPGRGESPIQTLPGRQLLQNLPTPQLRATHMPGITLRASAISTVTGCQQRPCPSAALLPSPGADTLLRDMATLKSKTFRAAGWLPPNLALQEPATASLWLLGPGKAVPERCQPA